MQTRVFRVLVSDLLVGMIVLLSMECSGIIEALESVASFPGSKKERRGPGTHCLRMCRVPQKNMGHRIPSYT